MVMPSRDERRSTGQYTKLFCPSPAPHSSGGNRWIQKHCYQFLDIQTPTTYGFLDEVYFCRGHFWEIFVGSFMEPTRYLEQERLSHTIKRLLDDEKAERGERRDHTRQPFFGPVTIVVPENGKQRDYSCFSRDISPTGIGLLHNMPFECGEVTLTVQRQSGDVCFRGEIIWCRPCGEGWYLSGVRFIATV